jgi:hypothetical protein
MTPRINRDRLLGRLETFNRIGALPFTNEEGARFQSYVGDP